MNGETYLFIDGAYLNKRYSEKMQDFFGSDSEIDFRTVQLAASCRKAFYYDCFHDIQGDGETEDEFRKRLANQESFFDNVRSLPGYHVRLGTVTGSYKKIRQKQVDVLLAVEMLSHAFNKNMDQAVLIAGDLDFKPIIDALIQRGTYVTVLYAKASANSELYWAADTSQQLGIRTFWDWSSTRFKMAHPLPQGSYGPKPPLGAVERRRGTAKGKVLRLLENGRTFTLYAEGFGDNAHSNDLSVSFDGDLEMLEKYFTEEFSPIEWS